MNSVSDQSAKMLASERRAAISLALVYVFRMLGLFMVLPVLALYADSLSQATPLLLGLAVGAYGLTQAILQIPFGMLSDRLGRKPVIYIGLALFAGGSVLAAVAEDVYLLIAARALQGSGAIAAAVMALAADLSRDSQRTKVMAIIGASIGASFLLSLIVGPLVSAWLGVPGLFWMTVGLAVFSACVVAFVVPSPQTQSNDREVGLQGLKRSLADSRLLSLDLSVLLLHGLLTAIFVYVPFALRDRLGLSEAQHWWVYLPLMTVSLLLAAPVIMKVGRTLSIKLVMRLSVVMVSGAAAVVIYTESSMLLLIGLGCFFLAFNVLEASLPAQLSKLAVGNAKGAALGMYSSSQFLGAFLGGVLGGWASQFLSSMGFACTIVALGGVWLAFLWNIKLGSSLLSCAVEFSGSEASGESMAERLLGQAGVKEVSLVGQEKLIYVWFEPEIVSESEIIAFTQEM